MIASLYWNTMYSTGRFLTHTWLNATVGADNLRSDNPEFIRTNFVSSDLSMQNSSKISIPAAQKPIFIITLFVLRTSNNFWQMGRFVTPVESMPLPNSTSPRLKSRRPRPWHWDCAWCEGCYYQDISQEDRLIECGYIRGDTVKWIHKLWIIFGVCFTQHTSPEKSFIAISVAEY